MSTLLIMGLGALAWLLVCVIVLAACIAARRGDEALSDDSLALPASVTTISRARNRLAHRAATGPARPRASRRRWSDSSTT